MIKYLLIVSLGLIVFEGDDRSRIIERTHPASSATTLTIVNQFGNVQVEEWDKNEVYIQVSTTTTETNPVEVKKLLDKVSIDIREVGNQISYTTRIDKKPEGKVEVNYTVKMPRLAKMELTNGFGDIQCGELRTPATIRLSYGTIRAAGFLSDSFLAFDFSKGEVLSISGGTIEFNYSDIEIGTIGTAEITSKFSQLDFGKASYLNVDIKYGEIKIGRVTDLVANAHFADFKVNEVTGSVRMMANYVPTFEVGKLASTFTNFQFSGQFSPVYVQLAEGLASNFLISLSNAELSSIVIGEAYSRRVREESKSEFQGTFGGGHSVKMIRIESSFGNVKLR